MDITVDEFILEERATLAFHARHNLARVEVCDEAALHTDRPLLQSARENHQYNNDDSERDDYSIGKASQIVTDIKEDRCGYRHAEEDREDQRQTIETTLCPQFLKFITVIVLHHQGPHKWRDADERH